MSNVEYVVDLVLWPSDRRFRCPGSGCRSFLYRFETAESMLGAHAVTADGHDLAPGTEHQGAVLAPWAEIAQVFEVAVGDRFIIWYGGDVGEGIVTAVRSSDR